MIQRIPQKFSARSLGWTPFVITGDSNPPRDPEEEEDEEEEEEEEEDDEEDGDHDDEKPAVREPDEH